MLSNFKFGLFCSFITFSVILFISFSTVLGSVGSVGSAFDQDNFEHLENIGDYQDDYHVAMPYMPTVKHQAPLYSPQQVSSKFVNYNQVHQNGVPDYNQKAQNNPSIIIKENKPNVIPLPIVIKHGKGHLKHYSDIIIIGKDCKEDHMKTIPVFAPKFSTPIHLHQEQKHNSIKHYLNDENWYNTNSGHWPEPEAYEQHSSHRIGNGRHGGGVGGELTHSAQPFSQSYDSEMNAKEESSLRSLWL